MRATDGHTAAGAAPDEPPELDRLIAELRARDIGYLSGARDPALADAVAVAPWSSRRLLRRLAVSAEPRIRDAVIALLLLHPALAALDSVTAWQDEAGSGATPLAMLVTVAAYQQHRWCRRLDLVLGPTAWLANAPWRAGRLPAPWLYHGELGLRQLAHREGVRRGRRFNDQAAWQRSVDLLLAQEWLRRRRDFAWTPWTATALREGAPTRVASGATTPSPLIRARGLPRTPRGGSAMSMRPPVDRGAIEAFLRRLGQEVQGPGRVYLVGGTTMVFEGYRARSLHIDLVVEAEDPGPILAAIRRLKDDLQVNVEIAGPGDFIPLPAGWRERSRWIGRFGPLDVFHFDLASVALSKVERGTEQDYEDALALIRQGALDLDALDAAFVEVLPRVETEGLAGMDAERFAAQYQVLHGLLGAP